ncbi:hypothetical protein [Nonomuraea sp. NPDC050540]|uniref:hypothetical protein n=1 Tax=Nonomuraea sp. NPDC050540 TaxID=3364367 RepID=UPI0037B7D96D
MYRLGPARRPGSGCRPQLGLEQPDQRGQRPRLGRSPAHHVCDLADDSYKVEAEYATSMLGIYTVADDNGARFGCGSDRTFISRIDVFKLCVTRNGFRQCEGPVWIKRR